MTDERPTRQTGLLRGLSSDEDARERSLANLQQNAATKHGAYSAALRQPLEDQHRDRLRSAYAAAPDDLVNAQAKRAAIIDLLSAFIADHGVIHRVKGRPDVTPAARELRLLLDASDRAATTLGALQREADKPNPNAILQEVLDEIAAEAARAANDGDRDD